METANEKEKERRKGRALITGNWISVPETRSCRHEKNIS